ncbi:hypothetical protein OSTOST_01674, partial [Ostertagia ostertagi]
MDLLYDIEHLNDTLHQVLAHISPLRCQQVCWHSFLLVRSGSTDYRADAPQECRDIESTTSVTYLRHMKQYAVEKHSSGSELVVETELNEKTEEGFVTLSALNLAKNDTKPKTKTFSTSSSNGTFHLPLSPDAVYAAQYQYTKVKPFHFTMKEHFLIETASFFYWHFTPAAETPDCPVILEFLLSTKHHEKCIFVKPNSNEANIIETTKCSLSKRDNATKKIIFPFIDLLCH